MELIKQLRDKTGAGIGDCKKALDEAGQDIDKAIDILRKKGITKASKRSDREASEGIVKVLKDSDGKNAYIMEINSETDFVARNEKFQEFADRAIKTAEENKITNLDDLLNFKLADGTVKEELDSLSGVIAEKLEISKLESLSGESVAAYSHLGGRIGVIVAFDKIVEDGLTQDIAMQIAASNPKCINPEEVDAEEINKEKEIYKEQLAKEGKPENIMEKIIEGKINKYYEEVCLNKQEFIKDDKMKVEEVLGGAKVVGFIRYSL